MKTINRLFRIFVILLLHIYSSSLDAEERAHIRLNYEHHQDKELTVSIMMKSNAENGLSLGSQNYRLYYNTEELNLKTDLVSSSLLSDKYDDVILEEHVMFTTSNLNQLKFEDVGFVNFTVLLSDFEEGGIHISQEWRQVASITFINNGFFNPDDVVLAMPESTDQYASAYIEMTEWINAYETQPIRLTVDQSYDMNTIKNQAMNNIDLLIGPNPTVDYVYVIAQERLASLSLYNMNGQMISSTSLDGNESKMDLSGRSAGIYLIEIEDQEGNMYIKEVVKN